MGKVIPFRQAIPPAPPERALRTQPMPRTRKVSRSDIQRVEGGAKQHWKRYYRELSREHREQMHRFRGIPFDDEQSLRSLRWAAFCIAHHRLQERCRKHKRK